MAPCLLGEGQSESTNLAKLVALGGREEFDSIGTLASNSLLAGSMSALVALHVFKLHQLKKSKEMPHSEECLVSDIIMYF